MEQIKYYMAPMEGVTGYVFRNAYAKYYGGIERYFTPFVANKKLGHREKNDVCPEHNAGMAVVPQILTNRAEDFLAIAEILREYGYDTVNLNLGCPSGTVAARGRGAGFLAMPDKLDHFLEEIFEKCPLRISIKTRIGKENPAEWEQLLAIYEKYPLEELIVHPRVQTDFYKNRVNLEAFALAEKSSRHSLCYNGDIVDAASAAHIRDSFPSVDKFMIGRGLIKRPWLLEELSGGRQEKQERKERFYRFHNELLEGYRQQMSGDKNTLFKMKELWAYWGENFADADRQLKKIRKCERVAEYECLVDALFREKELCV